LCDLRRFDNVFFPLANLAWMAQAEVEVYTPPTRFHRVAVEFKALPEDVQTKLWLLHQRFLHFKASRKFEYEFLPAFFERTADTPIGQFLDLFERAAEDTQKQVMRYVWGDDPTKDNTWKTTLQQEAASLRERNNPLQAGLVDEVSQRSLKHPLYTQPVKPQVKIHI
jgi:hypothetical protein